MNIPEEERVNKFKEKLKEALNFVPIDERPEIEKKLEAIEKDDLLLRTVALLSKYYPDVKIVFLITTNSLKIYLKTWKTNYLLRMVR